MEGTVALCLLELMNAHHRFLEAQTHSVLTTLNTTQWRTLILIRYNPDQTQQTLARHVQIAPASMTPIVDLLERKGWVRRHPSATNRSAYGLRMTAAGKKAYQRMESEIVGTQDLVAQILGDRGCGELTSLMTRLRDGLNDACARQARRQARSRSVPKPGGKSPR